MGKFGKGAQVAPAVAQVATENKVDKFLAKAALDAAEQENAPKEHQDETQQD